MMILNRNGFVVYAFCLALLSGCATDSGNSVNATEPEDGNNTYEKQVREVLGGGETPDLAMMRDEYIKTGYFRSSATNDIIKEMKTRDENGDYEGVTRLAEANVTRFFVNIEFHYLSMKAFKNLGKQDKYLWHRKMLYDIIQDIMAVGDGMSPSTAYIVISESEEYVIMNFMGLRYTDRSAFSRDGHYYEKFIVEPNDYYKARQIYFNVDVTAKEKSSYGEDS